MRLLHHHSVAVTATLGCMTGIVFASVHRKNCGGVSEEQLGLSPGHTSSGMWLGLSSFLNHIP